MLKWPQLEMISHLRLSYSFFRAVGNKAYPLQLGSEMLPVYCHMTDDLGSCGSGGWTLVMKIDGNQVLTKCFANDDGWYNILITICLLSLSFKSIDRLWSPLSIVAAVIRSVCYIQSLLYQLLLHIVSNNKVSCQFNVKHRYLPRVSPFGI